VLIACGGCAESGVDNAAVAVLADAGMHDASSGPFPGDSGVPRAPDTHCVTASFPAEPLPVELLVLLDASISMAEGNKWDAAVRAITRFADTASITGLSLAVSAFPLSLGDECKVNRYAQPLVPMQRTPDVASVVKQAFLEQLGPDGQTSPVRPALDGSLQYLRARAETAPFAQRAVVLVTDGLGNRCDTSDDTVLTLAAQAVAGTPALPIFVLAMPGGMQQSFLDRLAQVGGTERAFAITPEQGAEDALVQAMQATRERSTACAFRVPTSPDGQLIPSSVTVALHTDPTPQTFGLLDRPERCAGETWGFYYDDNTAPNLLTLCPAACNAVKASGAQVTLDADCLWKID